MKTTRTPLQHVPICLLAAALGALTVQPALAATDYWLGGVSSGNWNSGANWISGNAPSPSDSLVFTNKSGAVDTASNNFAAGTAFNGITFSNSAASSAFLLTGNGILLSGSTNGVIIGVTNATQLAETVSNNLTLDWGYHMFYSPSNGSTLNLNGAMTANQGGVANFGPTNVASTLYAVDGTGLIAGLGGAGLIGNSDLGGGFSGLATINIVNGKVTNYTYSASQTIASGNMGVDATTTLTGGFTNETTTLTAGFTNAATTLTTAFASSTLVSSLVVSNATNIFPGQVVSGTGVPSGVVTVSGVTGTTVSVSLFTSTAASDTNNYTFASVVSSVMVANPTNIVSGQVFSGTGVPSGVTVSSVTGSNVSLSTFTATASSGAGNYTFASVVTSVVVASATGIVQGDVFTGTGVPVGVTVSSVAGTTINLSSFTATASSSGSYVFSTGPSEEPQNLELTAITAINYSLAGGAGPTYGVGNTYINTIVLTNNTSNKVGIGAANGGTLVLGSTNAGTGMYVGGIYMPVGNNAQGITVGDGSANYITCGPMTGNPVPGEIIIGINGNNTSNEGEMNGPIKDNLSGGKVTVVYTGSGSLFVNVTNSYTGGTYVNLGRVQCNTATALGFGPVYISGGSADVSLQNLGANTMVNNFFLSQGSIYVGAATEGSLRLDGTGSGILTGAITLQGNPITPGAAAGTTAATIGDRISSFTAGDLTALAGQITGSGTLEFYAGVSGMVFVLSNVTANANNWTGGLIIDGASGDSSDLKILASNQLGTNNVTLINAGTGFARLDLNGFNDTIGGLSSTLNSTNQAANFGAAPSTLTMGANNASATFGGLIEDNGFGSPNVLSIVKTGTGTETLTGTNTYYGSTTVSGGTLLLGGYGMITNSSPITINGGTLSLGTNGSVANNPVTVASGGTLDVSKYSGGFTLQSGQMLVGNGGVVTGSVTIASSSTLNLNSGSLNFSNNVTFNGNSTNYYTLPTTTGGAYGLVAVLGNVNFGVNTKLFINYTTLQPGRYHLITYGTANTSTPVENGNVTLGGIFPSGRGQTYTLDDSISGEVDLVVTGSTGGDFLTWVGDGVNNNWDIQTTTNWFNNNSSSLDYFYNGDFVTFNDSGSASPAVNLTTTLQPHTLTVSNNASAYVFAGGGSLSGNFTLTKQGPGSLALMESGGDAFSAGIVVNGGSLILSNSNVSISGGITVNTGSVTVAQSGTISGGLTVAGNGTALVIGSGTINGGLTSSGSLTVSNGPNISGNLAVNGGATLMDQTTTFSGNATIANGAVLQVGDNDANGTLGTASTATILDNGGLVFNRSDSGLEVQALISGTGGLTNNGPGTVEFGGTETSGAGTTPAAETYTGPTVINAGILELNTGNNGNSGLYASSRLTINTNGTVEVLTDNSLAGSSSTVGSLPITINAGGILTAAPGADSGTGTSCHIRGILTLNGGTLTNSGTSINTSHGSWDVDDGVAVPGGPFTSLIACLSVIPDQSGGTLFSITNGTTPSGIDLLVSGQFVNDSSTHDTGIIKTGPGTMALDNTNTYALGTTINGGTLQLGTANDTTNLTGLLGTGNVTNNATLSFASSQTVTITNLISGTNGTVLVKSGQAVINGIITGTNTLLVTGGKAILTATNTYIGNTLVNGGTLALAGGGWIISTAQIAVGSNAIFDMSGLTIPARTNLTLSLTNGTLVLTIPTTPNTNEIATTLNLGGTTNLINFSTLPQAVITSYPQRFPLIGYTTLNGTLNLGIGLLPTNVTPSFVGYITNANGLVDLVLTGGPAPVRPLTWKGEDPNNPTFWDVANSVNWVTTNGTPTTYNQVDLVTFNDTATGPTSVNLTTVLTPGTMTVSNNNLTYTFNGSGRISGTSGLTKQGGNLVVLDENNNSGSYNDFSGGLTISAGTVQVGTGDGNGWIGTGPVVDNIGGTLAFDDAGKSVSTNGFSGGGLVIQEGGNTLQLAGNNTSFAGDFVAVTNANGSSSVLQLGSATALGAFATMLISNNCTLDLNGFTGEGIVQVGNGTVDNTSGIIPPTDIGLTNVTLTGNAVFATSGDRWDLRSPSGTTGSPAGASLICAGGQPYNIAKTGTGPAGTAGFFSLASVTVDTNLANIDIQGGTFEFNGNTTGLGNPTNTVTAESGAIFQMYETTNLLNKVIVVDDGGTLGNANSANTIIGPVVLNNTNGNVLCYFNIVGTSLTLNGPLSGNSDPTLYKEGISPLYLNGNSANFVGNVTVTLGALVINGTLGVGAGNEVQLTGSTITNQLVVNGTLLGGITNSSSSGSVVAGSGTVSNSVDMTDTLVPGGFGVAGTLTISGDLVLESGSTADFDLNANNTLGSGVNDLVAVGGNLTVNGNVNINPIGLLKLNVPYTIFTYPSTSNLVWNANMTEPGTNGYTFTFNTNTPGLVTVYVNGGPPVWNGGSAFDSDWSDSNNWGGIVITSPPDLPLYFAGVTRLNNTNDSTVGSTYGNVQFAASAGAFVLNGNPVTMGGTSVLNSSTNAQTINIPLSFGGSVTFDGAGGPLIISGGLTNNAAAFTTTTLSDTGMVSDLIGDSAGGTNVLLLNSTNANWTMVDNAASAPITAPCSIEVFSGTLIFGSSNSAPNFTSTTPNGAPNDTLLGQNANQIARLNMINGSLTLASRLDTGANIAGSTGIVSQVGGIITINGQLQGANIGGGVSIISVSGGTNNVPGGTLFVASRGNGTLNISGNGIVNCGAIDVSRNAQGATLSSVGVVNLNGGTLKCSSINTATANSATGATPPASGSFNFNGGTLLASGTSATFMTDSATEPVPLTVTVKSGGAIINDGGFAISILEALLHDATLGGAADGGLFKLGGGAVTLTKANTYNGGTIVGAGTLALSGSGTIVNSTNINIYPGATLDVSALNTPTLVMSSGQLVQGSGTINGNLSVGAGATVMPGTNTTSFGTLTVTNAATLQGTALMKLNAAGANDQISAASNYYGGTLTVTNLSGTLTGGQSFQLFVGSSSGTFSATNLPPLGGGLFWNWNPANGTLTVMQTVNLNPATVNFQEVTASGSMQFSWAPDHLGWQLYTNGIGLAATGSWFPVPGSAAVTNETITINPAIPNVFFQLRYP